MTFDQVRNSLTVGQVINNWTVLNGYFGDDFVIERLAQNYIRVRTKLGSPQRINKADVDYVLSIWTEYKAKQIQRQEIRKKTFVSKYVISILRDLEEEGLAVTP